MSVVHGTAGRSTERDLLAAAQTAPKAARARPSSGSQPWSPARTILSVLPPLAVPHTLSDADTGGHWRGCAPPPPVPAVVLDGAHRGASPRPSSTFRAWAGSPKTPDTDPDVVDTQTTRDDPQVAAFGELADGPTEPFVIASNATYAAIDPTAPAVFSRVVLTALLLLRRRRALRRPRRRWCSTSGLDPPAASSRRKCDLPEPFEPSTGPGRRTRFRC
jgi:hypothetical protein